MRKSVAGLADGRRITKPIEKMPEIEKLFAENKILQLKN